jgi:hypothetical protein
MTRDEKIEIMVSAADAVSHEYSAEGSHSIADKVAEIMTLPGDSLVRLYDILMKPR